ncbi:MAG: LysM peptidoglycan-binding domain-containing protein [Desulfuromonadales bacterium]|nr:LysM peptidoglycan-binding domain-containing protein [Desulfuromonadales bacterium]
MMRRTYGIIAALLLLAVSTPGWSQQRYLYTPKAVSPEENVQKSAGILVQEVQVHKGDTLTGLSRKFSGHGSYFPQILLFNEIKDPDKIYSGDTLKLPVKPDHALLPKEKAAGTAPNRKAHSSSKASQRQRSVKTTPKAVTELSGSDLKMPAVARELKRDARNKAVVSASHVKAVKQPAAAVNATAEQQLYERAIKAYRQNDCRVALELFDRFLAEYPSPALAADANLYKAECYLKQSNQ